MEQKPNVGFCIFLALCFIIVFILALEAAYPGLIPKSMSKIIATGIMSSIAIIGLWGIRSGQLVQ